MNILLVGPPGAGKSTQGRLLASRLQIPYISSGDLFRDAEQVAGPPAQQIRAFVERGEYVPDQLTNELVLARLAQPDATRGFVLDGYPRTLPQAVALDAALATEGRQVDVVLYITAPMPILKQRLEERLVAEGRTDDVRDIAEKRLETYRKQIQPVLDYYAGKGLLVQIDGAQTISVVCAAVNAALSSASDKGPP